MKTSQQDLIMLTKSYRKAMPDVLVSADKLQVAMGIDNETYRANGKLIVVPWHMPHPEEFCDVEQKKSSGREAVSLQSLANNTDPSFDHRIKSDLVVRAGQKKSQPSHNLERCIHDRRLAQRLPTSQARVSAPLQVRDTNLPIPTSRVNVKHSSKFVTSSTLKRKLSQLKLSSDSEESFTELVPNLSARPISQQRLCAPVVKDTKSTQSSGKHPRAVDEKQKEQYPPRRRTMPPISAVLAHGFRDIDVVSVISLPTPRSHAFEPWTSLSLSHRALSPTPAFLLSMPPVQHDDSDGTIYWKPSLPRDLSSHLANPLTLVAETTLQNLTFHLPTPKPTLAPIGNRKRPSKRPKPPHYQYEGPGTDTEIRLIRMILPPVLQDSFKTREAPFTDWLLLCLTSTMPRATSTRVLRSSAQAAQTRQPYLLLAFPTNAIKDSVTVARSPTIAAANANPQQYATTTVLRFAERGRLPLVYGVERDFSFIERWVQGFGWGQAALEVALLGDQIPCWL